MCVCVTPTIHVTLTVGTRVLVVWLRGRIAPNASGPIARVLKLVTRLVRAVSTLATLVKDCWSVECASNC